MGVVGRGIKVWVGVAQLGVSSLVPLVGWLVAAPLCLYGGLNFFGFLEQVEVSSLPGLTLNEFVLAAARIVYLLFLLVLLLQMSLSISAASTSWLKKLASCFPMFLGWAVLISLTDQGILSLAVWLGRQQYLAGLSKYIFYGVWFGLLVFVSYWVLRVVWSNQKKHADKSEPSVLALSLFILVSCLGVVVWILNSWFVSLEAMRFSLVSVGRSFLIPIWEEAHGSGLWSAFILEAVVKASLVLVTVSFWRLELQVDENR